MKIQTFSSAGASSVPVAPVSSSDNDGISSLDSVYCVSDSVVMKIIKSKQKQNNKKENNKNTQVSGLDGFLDDFICSLYTRKWTEKMEFHSSTSNVSIYIYFTEIHYYTPIQRNETLILRFLPCIHSGWHPC